MTKLNYLNRKSEGLKLGQIVAKDLRKRYKPSKINGHKDTSALEIMLEAKHLCDDGLQEMAEGLKDALAHPDTTRLAVLKLAQNDLTARSLMSLAQALPDACADLEELDLSGNNIAITTDEDVVAFEAFLNTLGDCKVLSKLSLANNNLGGVKAFEVFARVYMKHFKSNVIALENVNEEDADQADGDAVDQMAENFESMSTSPSRRKGSSTSPSTKSKTQSPRRSAARGLPSIPLIDFSSSSIMDCGALWLSYITPKHNWALSKFGRHIEADAGVLCSSNGSLSSVGSKLLHQAQLVVYDSFSGSEVSLNDSSISQSRHSISSPSHRRKVSNTAQTPNTIVRVHHIGHDPVEELESLRRKLQRTIIQDQGAAAVSLWRTALRLLTFVRHIMLEETAREHSPAQDTRSSPQSTRSFNGGANSSPDHATYASRVVMNPDEKQDAVLSITGISSSPVKSTILRSRKRRDSFSVGSDISIASDSPAKPFILEAPLEMSDQEPKMIGGLPECAWEIILGMLVDESGILSKRQRQAVIEYGGDRRTLHGETATRGKADSVQTWKVLEAMSCLCYD